jgi:Xaa-Pro dipeptidase
MEILQKIARGLSEHHFDAVIVSSADNITYCCGIEIPSQVIPIRERLVFCVIPASGNAVILVPDMEYTLTKSASCITDVRMYNEFTQDPVDELILILKESGVEKGRIAVEDDFIPGDPLSRLYTHMPEAVFAPARPFMSGLRTIKTLAELDKLRRVNQIAIRAHYYAAGKLHAGMTELQLAQYLYEYLFNEGAETVNKLVVGSGERSEFGNANPTRRVIQKGELVRVDIFAKIGGYQSDVARTYIAGTPTPAQIKNWQIVVEASRIILEKIKPGAHTGEIYRDFRQFFEKQGLNPINFVGHGLGITLHEDPYISRYHDCELLPGMVLAVEPIYFPKGEGYQIEDIIAVTDTGSELFTDFGDPAKLLTIEA